MYKFTLNYNKIYGIFGILFVMLFCYKNLLKKEKKRIYNKYISKSSDSSKNTSSILPNPKERINNIKSDLKYLENLCNTRTDEQMNLINNYGDTPENYFFKLCEEKNIKYNKEKINKLINYLDKTSNKLKEKYKINRPHLLGKKLDIKINSLVKPETFSYPCGRVFKSKLLSYYFSVIDPRYDFEFQQITKDIELACLYAGINTPFDIRGSLILSQELMKKKILKKFL
jgi:hypothetical protein